MTPLGSAGSPRNPVRYPCPQLIPTSNASEFSKAESRQVASADASTALASPKVRLLDFGGGCGPPICTSETARPPRLQRRADRDGPGLVVVVASDRHQD